MATFYGDAISSTNNSLDVAFRASVAKMNGRFRMAHSRATTSATTSDVIRMFPLPTTTRLYELFVCSDGAGTAGAINVGLHLAGEDHDGDVVDADLFADAVTISAAAGPTEIFDDRSGGLTAVDRGKMLWELAGASADPGGHYDVTITPSTSISGGATELVLFAFYLAGD